MGNCPLPTGEKNCVAGVFTKGQYYARYVDRVRLFGVLKEPIQARSDGWGREWEEREYL